jgi:hypothetical protein
VVPAILRFLSQQMRLQGEDVVEHPVDAASLEPMLGEQTRMLQVPP